MGKFAIQQSALTLASSQMLTAIKPGGCTMALFVWFHSSQVMRLLACCRCCRHHPVPFPDCMKVLPGAQEIRSVHKQHFFMHSGLARQDRQSVQRTVSTAATQRNQQLYLEQHLPHCCRRHGAITTGEAEE